MFPLFNFTRAVLRRVGSELDMAERKSVALHVRELVAPTADELGLKLWDVEYVKEGADYVLRITIDSDEGITIDDCERFHRAIDPVIDEDDPIENSYKLEVSSPGVERVLTRPEHFEAMKGEDPPRHTERIQRRRRYRGGERRGHCFPEGSRLQGADRI